MKDLRRTYEFGTISKSDLLPDPIEQFKKWFSQLASLDNPSWFEQNAMTLSTASVADGTQVRVTSRIVLLKYINGDSFVFFTNYSSEKANQLDSNACAALNFYWGVCDRQVRIEGVVSKTGHEISDEYFHARPVTSQLGAIVSPQSKVITDHFDLGARLSELEKQFVGKVVPRPEYWGGYQLKPRVIEFWQGKPSRLHDRFRYTRSDDSNWMIERLSP